VLMSLTLTRIWSHDHYP